MLAAPPVIGDGPIGAGVRPALGLDHGDAPTPAVAGGCVAVCPVEDAVGAVGVGCLVSWPPYHTRIQFVRLIAQGIEQVTARRFTPLTP